MLCNRTILTANEFANANLPESILHQQYCWWKMANWFVCTALPIILLESMIEAFNHLVNYIDLSQFSEVTYSVHILFKDQPKVVSVAWYDEIQRSIRKNLKDAHLCCFQQSRQEKTAILFQSIPSISTILC